MIIPYRYFVVPFFFLFLPGSIVFALEPAEILVIANKDCNYSVAIAQYYCSKRTVPAGNILTLPLGPRLNDTISRTDYEKHLAGPIREKLAGSEFKGRIKCLLTTYGVPIKVGGRGILKGQDDLLNQLKKLAEQRKDRIEQLKQIDPARERKNIERELAHLQSRIDYLSGKETGASVDSELSMMLYGDYELYRWQPNTLKSQTPDVKSNTLMVCRLDGPGAEVAKGLVDKTLAAEKTGLNGIACIDSRGIADDKIPYSFGHYDQSLRDLALLIRFRTKIPVKEERTEKLFEPNSCPLTALYCGWYSLKNYVDAFTFVDGAIGYHISSWEAIDLRDPNSSQWCPAMLKRGIAATMGAVAEPYLHSFPEPKAFFLELFNGRCLIEAYYHTNPFNSWQMVLVGDPLYRPFKQLK